MIDLKNLPSFPGCYLFKDSSNNIIYIGKAKDLKKRVSSYFSKKDHDEKTKHLVASIDSLELFVTTNEIEAFILENNLIKKYKPKYNIDLKDSKRFASLLITDEEFPRLLIARNKEMKGKYYGPFVSSESRDEVAKVLRNTFQLRTCNKLPKKACLRYHLNLCLAPCINQVSNDHYHQIVKEVESFLKGNTKELIEKMKLDMGEYSSKQEYEPAKIRRDQLLAIQQLSEKQKFELDKKYDEDVINYIINEGKVYLILFHIEKGILTTKNEFSFDAFDNFLEEFIGRYYSENEVPKEIILPHYLEDDSLKTYLESRRGQKVFLIVPEKGDKKELLDLVKRNIEVSFLAEEEMLSALRRELDLNTNPQVIECFDISNTQGSNSVGSMVQFKNGKPDKSNYRRFKIKTVDGSDDFASIYEIVRRKYYRNLIEKIPLPDLIVIDGGLGQLHSAVSALKDLGLKAPIISLAKKFEEIYLPGNNYPLRLKRDSKALKILVQIRDEAHRFAITYHRMLRSKEMLKTEMLK